MLPRKLCDLCARFGSQYRILISTAAKSNTASSLGTKFHLKESPNEKPAGEEYFKQICQTSPQPIDADVSRQLKGNSVQISRYSSRPSSSSLGHQNVSESNANLTSKEKIKQLADSNDELLKRDFRTESNDEDQSYCESADLEIFLDKDDYKIRESNQIPVDDVAPFVGPSFNLAKYVNTSETLQQFIKMGVHIYEWDKIVEVAEFILRLDFERDVKPYVQFLSDHGVPANRLGIMFTKNPQILKEDLDNLQTRINYLESKKFRPEDIAHIITYSPTHLNLSTVEVDGRLGYFQKMFSLTGNEVRHVITKLPKLVVWGKFKIEMNQMMVKEEFGFSVHETKQLFLSKPKIWISGRNSMIKRFHVLHNVMGLSHKTICQCPGSLLCREWKIEQRHLFLQSLGKAQYDPSLENYISLHDIISGTDTEFCKNVAQTSVSAFNDFLKTE